jgi:glycosyltransferase involved in cell wall biosynthesis
VRLLHVHSGNLYGGVETMLLGFAEPPAFADIEHRFALCFDGRISHELRQRRLEVELIGRVRARNPLALARARRRLAAIVDNSSADAIACHMPWSHALFAPVIRRCGIPLIFWMHDAASGDSWLERRARRTVPDLVLCNSRYTAATLPRLFPAVRHQVLYPSLRVTAPAPSPDSRTAVRAKFATSDPAVVILQASRLEAWKGHRVLLQALHHLRDIQSWICWIGGAPQRPQETAYLESLKTFAREAGLEDRVRFCGFSSNLNELLQAADIYCQPNLSAEPFGMVFAEAMAAGLPAISTNLGGVAELLDDECGALVPPDNPLAVAEILRSLIIDAGRRAVLGAAARSRVAQLCDRDRQRAQLASIVRSLIPGGLSEAANL